VEGRWIRYGTTHALVRSPRDSSSGNGDHVDVLGSAPLHLLLSDEPIGRLVDDLWSSLPADLRVLLLMGTGSSVSGCRLLHQDP
jgi:hypothetical protein